MKLFTLNIFPSTCIKYVLLQPITVFEILILKYIKYSVCTFKYIAIQSLIL